MTKTNAQSTSGNAPLPCLSYHGLYRMIRAARGWGRCRVHGGADGYPQ